MVVKNHERNVCQSQGSPNTLAKTQARQVNEQRSFFCQEWKCKISVHCFRFQYEIDNKAVFWVSE